MCWLCESFRNPMVELGMVGHGFESSPQEAEVDKFLGV